MHGNSYKSYLPNPLHGNRIRPVIGIALLSRLGHPVTLQIRQCSTNSDGNVGIVEVCLSGFEDDNRGLKGFRSVWLRGMACGLLKVSLLVPMCCVMTDPSADNDIIERFVGNFCDFKGVGLVM